MKRILTTLLTFLLLAACTTETVSTATPTPTVNPTSTLVPRAVPTIINHERPAIEVDFSPFENAGCVSNGYYYECDEQGALSGGCTSISKSDMLGGLSPTYPIAFCNYIYPEGSKKTVDFSLECFDANVRIYGWDCSRIVIYKDSQYILIKNMEEFRSHFVPVDSSEEALGFAFVSSDFYPIFGHEMQKNYVYYVQIIEDTYVEKITDGYIVHLFYTHFIGCGPHDTEAVDVKVTYDGYVKQINRYPIYRDPEEDSLCVD